MEQINMVEAPLCVSVRPQPPLVTTEPVAGINYLKANLISNFRLSASEFHMAIHVFNVLLIKIIVPSPLILVKQCIANGHQARARHVKTLNLK